jgi:hypothetical protein
MAVSFSLATAGSILLTQSGTGATGPSTSFALELLLFLLPLLLGGVALARVVGGRLRAFVGGLRPPVDRGCSWRCTAVPPGRRLGPAAVAASSNPA